jgi:shikimate kinase
MNNHIFIIGMMGSGKSTIAPLLSDKLKIPYIDIDQDLEEILNCNIVDIFKQYSEERFRILESRYFLEHIKNSSTIYSTGGGIVLDKQNRNALKKTGFTVFLKASIQTLYNRINNDTKKRPLLKNKLLLEKLLNQRIQYYIDCADLVVDTDKQKPKKIVNYIINKFNNEN